jgi:hypothetical protein
LIGSCSYLAGWGHGALELVEVVAMPSGKDVEVVVPHVLVPGWFVVLPD